MADGMESPRNIRLRIAYDGTRFAGWQVQPDQLTVQGCIESAIEQVSGEQQRLLCAGRTDSGVHALGQVVNFTTFSRIPAAKWRPALQTRLPEDIVILESDEVSPGFHSTFWARSKRYRYVIHNSVVANPFLRHFSWRIGQPLNVEAMQDAAECLLGTHDFRSFESHWPNKATSVRTVMDLTIQRRHACDLFQPLSLHDPHLLPPDGPGEFICLEIEADGFLYNMVRTITGTLTYVGRGTWTRNDVQRILASQDRSIAGGTAPACGLFMVQVNYRDGNREPDPGPPGCEPD